MHIQILYLHTLMPTPKQPLGTTLVADARAAVDACAGWNARLAARRITSFLNRRMQDSGLTLAQFGLIAQIAATRDGALNELAQRIGLDQSTLSRNLQVLEGAGLIEIAAGGADGRRRAVWLTEKGVQSLEAGTRRLEAGAWRARQAPRPGGGPAPSSGGRGAGGGIGGRRPGAIGRARSLRRWLGRSFWRGDNRRNRGRRSRAASFPTSKPPAPPSPSARRRR